MNQILNLLSFLMELVFGRDASMRRSRSQTIRSLIVIAFLAVSLFTNYYMFKSLYSATAKYIAIKEQMADYEALKVRNTYLELHNEALQKVMAAISPGILLPQTPGQPPKTPSHPVPTPAPVPSTPTVPHRDEHPVSDKETQRVD